MKATVRVPGDALAHLVVTSEHPQRPRALVVALSALLMTSRRRLSLVPPREEEEGAKHAGGEDRGGERAGATRNVNVTRGEPKGPLKAK